MGSNLGPLVREIIYTHFHCKRQNALKQLYIYVYITTVIVSCVSTFSLPNTPGFTSYMINIQHADITCTTTCEGFQVLLKITHSRLLVWKTTFMKYPMINGNPIKITETWSRADICVHLPVYQLETLLVSTVREWCPALMPTSFLMDFRSPKQHHIPLAVTIATQQQGYF